MRSNWKWRQIFIKELWSATDRYFQGFCCVIAFICRFYVSFAARVSTESTMSLAAEEVCQVLQKKHHPLKCINIGIYTFNKNHLHIQHDCDHSWKMWMFNQHPNLCFDFEHWDPIFRTCSCSQNAKPSSPFSSLKRQKAKAALKIQRFNLHPNQHLSQF